MVNLTKNDDLLEELNDEKALLLIPAIIYVAILMFVGVIGNILVCVFYGCKTKHTTNTFFIIVLAIFDLISCVITMPIEIVDLRFFYMFTNAPACKMARFLNYFATLGSAVTLLAIAVDRHRRLCKPFKKQLQVKNARIACVVASSIALLFSWPAVIFFDSVSVNVTDPSNESIVLEGFDCTMTKDEAYKSYLFAFNAVHFVAFIVASIILGILYCLIGRVIFKHKRRRFKYTSTRLTSSDNSAGKDSTETNISLEDNKHSNDLKSERIIQDGKTDKGEVTLRTKTGSSMTTQMRPSWRESHSGPKEHSPDIKTMKYTIVMLVITVVFVLSFLPYLILVLWRMFQSGYEVDLLSDGGLIAFQIGIRSYLLNSAINPLLYGFFNPKFRTFFYYCLCRCCAKEHGQFQFSTSSEGH